jgi:hypothetical protein
MNGIAHHREVLVVNGQGGIRGENRLRREAASQDRNKFFHIVLLICIMLTLFDTGRRTFLDGISKNSPEHRSLKVKPLPPHFVSKS